MEIFNSPIWYAFLLASFAGLSTGIGSAIAFFAKRTNTKLLSVALGFSAGVMVYISFVEIFQGARSTLIDHYGSFKGLLITILSFFGGMALIGLIDKFVPSFENPHEVGKIEDMEDVAQARSFRKLYRLGIFTALAIAIHNFPEGLATFVAALNDPTIGLAIAIAIAIHNIPEGIAVSIPIYYATSSHKKAFIYSFLSGLAEPIGALIGYLLILPFLSKDNADIFFGIILSAVAGIMVFISFDELLPSAEEYGEHHLSLYGLLGGMAVMAISLLYIA